jgi:hypothetical protein
MVNTKKKRGPRISAKRQAIHDQWLKAQATGDKLHAENSNRFVNYKQHAKPQA